MVRENTKKYARMKRFPRLEVSSEVRHMVRTIHSMYNRIACGKNYRLRNFNYDIYKTKRARCDAKVQFVYLAEKLLEKNINPVLYIKVMARFGRFRKTTYMPSPKWLAKDRQIKNFRWFYRSEKKCYTLKLDFKKAMDGWSDLDIYSSVRDSAEMVKVAMERTGMKIDEVLVVMKDELSPWFLRAYINSSQSWKDFWKVDEFMRKHRHIREVAKKALKRSGVCF